MYDAAAISSPNKLAPKPGVRADENSAPGQDFAAALSRIAYSAIAAAIMPNPPVPNLPKPASVAASRLEDDKPEPTERTPDRSRETAGTPPPFYTTQQPDEKLATRKDFSDEPADTGKEARQQPEAAPKTAEKATPSDTAQSTQSTPAATTTQRSAAALPFQPVAADKAAVTVQTPVAQALVAQTSAPQTSSVDAPVPGAPSPDRSPKDPQSQPTGPLTAQIVDADDGDALPQIGHTLSSRSALIAQTDAAKPGPSADILAKNANGDPAIPSLFTGAIPQGTQSEKGKSPTKAGNNTPGNASGNGAQNANAANALQVQAQPSAAAAAQQQKFATTLAGTGANSTGQQASGARAEPFALTGVGPAASQLGPRETTPTQPLKAPPPVPARLIANQAAVQIQKGIELGDDRINIQLKPASLGRVEVRLDVGSDGRVAAVITADRSDTLDLLQRDARILQNALQDAGLQADGNSLSFELRSQGQAFDQSSTGSAFTGARGDSGSAETAGANTVGASVRHSILSEDRIDIQV